MRSIRRICALVVSTALVATASAQTVKSFADVRAAVTGEELLVSESLVIEGVVVSDCDSPNMDQNPNLSTSRIDSSVDASI